MVPIELTEEDAQRFKLFMEYYDNIKFLIENGAFELHIGKVEFHRDERGIISDIVVSKYSRMTS